MTNISSPRPPAALRLFGPSEWRLILALHRLGRPCSVAEICQVLPSLPAHHTPLPDATIPVLLDRLKLRGVLLSPVKDTWGPLSVDFLLLLRDQIHNFIAVYIQDDSTSLQLLRDLANAAAAALPAS